MNKDTDVYKAMLQILRYIRDLASQNIDKKFQLNTYESLVIVTTCLWQNSPQNITFRIKVYSVSVILCCYVRYMLKNML